MRIFITGASGYVGSVVTEKAIEKGYQVTGLARSSASAKKLEALGAQVLSGTLEDRALLTQAAKDSDAVLHLGFVHEFNRPYDELMAIDIAAIKALGSGLSGTNKPLVVTTGTAVVKSDPGKETDEQSPLTDGHLGQRALAEQAALATVQDGVKGMVIRLAPYVYGRGGSYFVPTNMQGAAKTGYAIYVGDGGAMTSAGDVDASAELYLLAMEAGTAGDIFNCTTETDVQIKKLAEAIAKALSLETKSVSLEEANSICGPFTAQFLQLENRASSAKARRNLGWNPQPKFKLLDDIVNGSYKELAKSLKSIATIP